MKVWTAETCFRFGYTVHKSGDALIFQACSQSGNMFPQSIQPASLARPLASARSFRYRPRLDFGAEPDVPETQTLNRLLTTDYGLSQ